MRRFAVLPAVMSALLLLTSPVAALGTLDQQQTDAGSNIEFGQVNGVLRPVGQTFTAGLSGALDTVALYPVLFNLSGVLLQIRSVSGGLPTNTILASETVTSSATDTWVQTTFASPATVVASTQYAIVLVPPDASTSLRLGFAGDVYAGGSLVATDFQTGMVWQGFDSDYAFQTYVTTPPPLAKTDAPDPVVAGTNLTYTITVQNGTTTPWDNVEVQDSVPTGTTFVSFSAPAGWSATTPPPGGSGTVSATRATLTAGDGLQAFSLVVHVDATLAGGTILTNAPTLGYEVDGQGGVQGLPPVTTTVLAATLPNAAMSRPSPAAPLATIGFGLLLFGSLGALAYATTRARR